MFNRHMILVAMLAGAVALPYFTSSDSGRKMLEGLVGSAKSHAETAPGTPTPSPYEGPALPPSLPHHVLPSHTTPLDPSEQSTALGPTGQAPQTLSEVFRFDITMAWISERWPRVSAGLSELDLQGYRVPLVTGTSEGDLAGSLTYYFNKKQQLDRIIFHGTTGDPRQLVSLVTARYELKRQTTDDPGLFLYQRKWFGKPVSELRIRPARVLRADAPHERFEVDLAMKRK